MTRTESSASSSRFDSLEEWLSWLETLHPKQIDMSLGRVEGVLAALGIADPPYQVVTVAGTNGKGSCVACLEQIYLSAGYRVGAFTSPHLVAFNERIRFDGQDADDETLVEVFELIDESRGDLTLSYFEASAVAAMLHFARAGAEVVVFEVGMGGRLDAVNAIDADAALIVSIDLDHMEYLGENRDLIGREKAGIVRDGRPVIVADRDPPQGLLDEISRRGGRAELIGVDFAVQGSPEGLEFSWRGEPPRSFPRPSFGGRIQLDNAAASIAAVVALNRRLPVADSAIAAGLSRVMLRGRFDRRVKAGTEWIFDVAHNPAAAALFFEALADLGPARNTAAVFGAMADKDLASVIRPFIDLVDAWFVGDIESERGAGADELVDVLGRLKARAATAYPDIESAARAAMGMSAERVLVFGSFYSVGPAMKAVGLY